ncbi:MAG: WD40 repeat domain-containing protein [Pirellulaceae bacterium]
MPHRQRQRADWLLRVVLVAGAWIATSLARPLAAETIAAVSMRRAIQSPADGGRQYPAVITALDIQPRGRLVAAAGDDHVIRIWNIDDGSLVHRLAGHTDWVRAVAFSPDGTTLVSCGNDRRVLLWDVASGRLTRQLAQHAHAVIAVAFSHSGRWVATAGFEEQLCILELAAGALEKEIPCRGGDIRAIAISSDDRYVAVGGRDGVIRIWDLTENRLVRESKAHTLRIRAVVFAQTDSQLISGSEDRTVRVWNWQTDDQSYTLPPQSAKILAMVTCGPQILATAGSDNIVRLWDLSARSELGQLTGHTGSVSALAFQDGILVSGGFDTFLRIWHVPPQVDEGVRSAQRVK